MLRPSRWKDGKPRPSVIAKSDDDGPLSSW